MRLRSGASRARNRVAEQPARTLRPGLVRSLHTADLSKQGSTGCELMPVYASMKAQPVGSSSTWRGAGSIWAW